MGMVVLKHYPNPTNHLNPTNPNSYQPPPPAPSKGEGDIMPKKIEFNGNGCS